MFTYHGLAVLTITKLFRNTELRIAYKTETTLRSHLQTNITISKYKLSNVYWLKCGECPTYTQGRQDNHLKHDTRNILGRLKIMERTPNLPCTYRI
jgi:hypothetical protein